MGRVLQVRVLAYTYAEDDVRKAWPLLWKLAFEDNTPGFPHEMKGVLELVRALDDLYQFGDVPDAVRSLLEEGLPRVVKDVKDMQARLADWDPQAANQATDRLEDGLGDLEKRVAKP